VFRFVSFFFLFRLFFSSKRPGGSPNPVVFVGVVFIAPLLHNNEAHKPKSITALLQSLPYWPAHAASYPLFVFFAFMIGADHDNAVGALASMLLGPFTAETFTLTMSRISPATTTLKSD
jgi:hypothetical protein